MPTSFYRKAKKVCVLFISLHTDINRLNFVGCRMYNKCRLVDCMIFLNLNWSWFATSHGHQGHGSSVCYFVFFLVFTMTFSYPFWCWYCKCIGLFHSWVYPNGMVPTAVQSRILSMSLHILGLRCSIHFYGPVNTVGGVVNITPSIFIFTVLISG